MSRPRVLHAPLNIAGGPGAISKGLEALGCKSTMLVFNEQPFERGFDRNLRLRKTGSRLDLPLNLARQFRTLAWALPRRAMTSPARMSATGRFPILGNAWASMVERHCSRCLPLERVGALMVKN